MHKKNPLVDAYFNKIKKWQKELEKLRKIILVCQLTEEIKWGVPCYTFQNSNIVMINGFKEYCFLSFFKGALLKDSSKLLVKVGENTQSARLIQFTNVSEIEKMKSILKAYIKEAIKIEKAGLKVELKKLTKNDYPEELKHEFDRNSMLKTAFEALTPGRQKAYVLHFSAPKQSKTRVSRIEKCTHKILDGKGINDCTCGQSKRLPICDGSHKYI